MGLSDGVVRVTPVQLLFFLSDVTIVALLVTAVLNKMAERRVTRG